MTHVAYVCEIVTPVKVCFELVNVAVYFSSGYCSLPVNSLFCLKFSLRETSVQGSGNIVVSVVFMCTVCSCNQLTASSLRICFCFGCLFILNSISKQEQGLFVWRFGIGFPRVSEGGVLEYIYEHSGPDVHWNRQEPLDNHRRILN